MNADRFWAGFYGMLTAVALIAAFVIGITHSSPLATKLVEALFWLSMPTVIVAAISAALIYDIVWRPTDGRQGNYDR